MHWWHRQSPAGRGLFRTLDPLDAARPLPIDRPMEQSASRYSAPQRRAGSGHAWLDPQLGPAPQGGAQSFILT